MILDPMEKTGKATTQTILQLKNNRPIVSVTAYDFLTAKIANAAQVDMILVGDSVGTTHLGFDSTVPVTLDMMTHHCRAVTRAKPSALVVGDIPFGEMAKSSDSIVEACCRLIQEGQVDAVKVEASFEDAPIIEKLVKAGIPVLGHIGLLPQTVQVLGKYRKFGKVKGEQEQLLKDAIALESAGCFGLIGEMIDADWTKRLTQELKIPLIGIGCGPACDGQILVSSDLLGLDLDQKPPSFVKVYDKIGEQIHSAFVQYRDEVINRNFPK
tara:strand:+ start:5486 stop:6292 length:807 start_codon:yes stop_codon:yes gene_type:complete